jgi:hypothetical protein
VFLAPVASGLASGERNTSIASGLATGEGDSSCKRTRNWKRDNPVESGLATWGMNALVASGLVTRSGMLQHAGSQLGDELTSWKQSCNWERNALVFAIFVLVFFVLQLQVYSQLRGNTLVASGLATERRVIQLRANSRLGRDECSSCKRTRNWGGRDAPVASRLATGRGMLRFFLLFLC